MTVAGSARARCAPPAAEAQRCPRLRSASHSPSVRIERQRRRVDLAADEATLDAGLGAGVARRSRAARSAPAESRRGRCRAAPPRRSARISSALPSTGTPSMPPVPEPRVVVDEADDLLPGVSRSSRAKLRPLRPAPTTSTRRRGPELAPATSRRDTRRAPRSERRRRAACRASASITKIARGKSPRGAGQPRGSRTRRTPRRARRRRCAPRRARPRIATRRGRARAG